MSWITNEREREPECVHRCVEVVISVYCNDNRIVVNRKQNGRQGEDGYSYEVRPQS